MNVMSLTGVSKTYRDTALFQDVTLGIDAGEKIGFVGRNGSGKSTLLKIFTGQIQPDTGIVARSRELTVSAVEQTPEYHPDQTIDAFLLGGHGQPASAETESGARLLAAGRSLCRELGMDDAVARLGSLSGGMVRKISLARCLAKGAGLLILDEPTNHLDLDTIEWLEAYLRSTTSGFVLVTHDRYFLDSVCGAILEIDNGRVYKYAGSYTTYLERKESRTATAQRAEERRVTILRKELEWLKRGPKARRGKDKSRKERAQSLMDPVTRRELSMREFSSAHRRLGKKVLELTAVTKSYDGRTVIGPFTYSFRRGERIGIVGPNGSGKTTFLQLVSGSIAADTGVVAKGESTVFACFDQTSGTRQLPISVLDYIKELGERVPVSEGATVSAEQFLERFLFPRMVHTTPLHKLSGGELRRLELVRLLARAPNFLLLDEPTNDLDLETIELLEDYLDDFPGCMLVVSHDRALLDRLTDYLFLLDGQGGIRGFAGSYADYRDTRAPEATDRRGSEPVRAPMRSPRERTTALTFKERQEYGSLMEEITALEAEHKDLEALFQQPVLDPRVRETSNRRYHEIAGILEQKVARWEILAVRDAG